MKIFLFLLVATICVHYCEAVWGYEPEEILEIIMKGPSIQPEELARIISKPSDGSRTLMNGVTIDELRVFSQVDRLLPYNICARRKFEEFERIRRKVSGLAALDKYCKHYTKVTYERCINAPADDIVFNLASASSRKNLLGEHSVGVKMYIMNWGAPNAPLSEHVKGYLRRLQTYERNAYKSACEDLDATIKEDLSYFDKDGKRKGELLEALKRAWPKRCCEIVLQNVA